MVFVYERYDFIIVEVWLLGDMMLWYVIVDCWKNFVFSMFGLFRVVVKGKNLNFYGICLVCLSYDIDVKLMILIFINFWCNFLMIMFLLFVCVCMCVFLMSVKIFLENIRLFICRCREFFNLFIRWYLVWDLGLWKWCVLFDYR